MNIIEKTINRFLPVALTTTEKVEYGRKLAQLHADYADMESQKKSAMDRFKLELEGLDGETARLARIVRNGTEPREVECQWRYQFEQNTKELIRMDTGEIVDTEAITPEERQLLLQLENERELGAVKKR